MFEFLVGINSLDVLQYSWVVAAVGYSVHVAYRVGTACARS